MRTINRAVWHCSADREGSLDGKDASYIDRVHRMRGFRKIGYHIVYLPDGTRQFGRGRNEIGAHAKGYNRTSIGLCYIGGLDMNGKPKDTRTEAQKKAMREDKEMLDYLFPGIEHVGHRDLSVDLDGDGVISKYEWMKACPCFDVATEF